MLENNEKIQGVNLSEVYGVMVKELPWSVMLSYINANANLLKMCTIGGHRLDPNKRDRFEKIIIREAEKAHYSEAVCNGVFASWYPVHTDLHQALEDYFHSDEYKTYRDGRGLGEDDYVLPDEKMDALFKIEDLGFWRILLCFSPLKFSKPQADKILNNQEGSAELVEKMKKQEATIAELTRKNEQLAAEAERLRAKQSADSSVLLYFFPYTQPDKAPPSLLTHSVTSFLLPSSPITHLWHPSFSFLPVQLAHHGLRFHGGQEITVRAGIWGMMRVRG